MADSDRVDVVTDVAAARAICDAATPGRWWAEEDAEVGGWDLLPLDHHGPHIALADDHGAFAKQADAEFCAAARTGWPAALTEIERLRATLVYTSQCAKCGHPYHDHVSSIPDVTACDWNCSCGSFRPATLSPAPETPE